MTAKLDKNAIKKLAKEKSKEGKTRQEIYDELIPIFRHKKEVADIVRFIPIMSKYKKYNFINLIFLIFLILMTLLSLFSPSIGIIWLFALIYFVATKDYKHYYWITFLGGFSVISILAISLFGLFEMNLSWIWILIMILISLVFILFGHLYPRLITPSYEKKRDIQTNTDKYIFD